MILALTGCVWRAPDIQPAAPVPLPLVRTSIDRRWYIPVEVKGEPWVWFLDTGYARSTCDDDLVHTLDLPTEGSHKVYGESGSAVASRTTLPALTLGGHTIEGLMCVVRDLHLTSSIRDPEEVPIAGVLGMDVLGAFQMVLDPEDAMLTLLPADTLQVSGSRLRRTLWDPRMRIAVDVGGRRIWPHVDTGTNHLYVDGQRLGLTPVTLREGVVIRGTGRGETTRDVAQYRETIGFGGAVLEEVVMHSRQARGGASGLLGLSLLSRYKTTWDFPNKRVSFTPARTRIPTWKAWRAGGVPLQGSTL